MTSLKEKSINAIIWNLIERYGVQLLSVVIGVILARLLTPADYGLIGMITVFFALAMVFVNSGFGTAYIQKKDATEVDASSIFFFNLVISIFFYVVLWFCSPLIASFYNQDQLIPLIRVMAVVLIINSFSLMQVSKLTKAVDFKKKSIISLVGIVISGIAGITAALSNYGVWSLVIQKITSTSINTIGLWLFYKWRPKFILSLSSLKEMLMFSSWILLANIMRTLFNNIYILTIGKFFPVAELGLYTKAKSYQKLVSEQPASAVGTVSFPVFSKLQENKTALKNSIKKFSQHTLFFTVPISAILFVIAKPLVIVVLTEKWLPMAPYFQLLLIAGFFYPINLINVKVLTAIGKTRLNFKISLIKNFLRIINIFFMYKFGVLYIIYGEIVVSFFSIIINGYYTKVFVNYSILEQLKDIAKTVLISLLVTFVGLLISNVLTNDYLKILICSFLVGGGYLLFQRLFNRRILESNLEIIKDKFLKK